VLLDDPAASSAWFSTKLERFRHYEARVIDGFFYSRVDVTPLRDLGDEAARAVAYTSTGPNRECPFTDSYILLRQGRLAISVGVSTYRGLPVADDLHRLAHQLLSRTTTISASPAERTP
jgi:hypothetical protein